ncbi:MAG TPA: low molecular weight protein arginine phosphatase [Longimicrobiaceae bacterium]|nr:low molecular weight protein arginine phosphatase [Longimicrobiaceae bacterium]
MEQERESSPATTTFNVLFVCTGNTCRSPMAEALARAALENRGWGHVRVASAGVSAAAGEPATPEAVSAAGRRGLDLRSHRSQPLTAELVDWADLVLCMSPSHVGPVAWLGGPDKVDLLGDFATGGTGGAVPDPFGADEAVYIETLAVLDGLVLAALDRLAPLVHP